MMQKLQRFGAAMFVPVLLFSFAGIVVALCSLFTNPLIFGSLAAPGTFWNGFWNVIANGGWTVFNQVAILFVVGLPIGLAQKSKGRAAMESLVIYLTFNYFINGYLTYWGPFFGVNNFARPLVANSTNGGLTEIAGIKTLDTSMVFALIIAGIVVWLHNRYFDKKLPDFLGTFQGSTFVYVLGFFLMIPVAFLTCLVWPRVQMGISATQHLIVNSGLVGIWIYNFLNRILIPTGLHHLVYIPFQYGPVVVAGGLQPYWLKHLTAYAESTRSLKALSPQLGFQLYGNEKVFLVPAICYAFYATAKKTKKKQTRALLIPAALTSFLAGITEPVDFTYLFAAPVLWVIYSLLAATMNTVMNVFGVVGNMTDGAIGIAAQNWIPLWANHWHTYVVQFIIGIAFAVLTFIIFREMILKYNYITPGREADDEETTLINKKQYQVKMAAKGSDANDPYVERATAYLDLLGGPENVSEMTSCATRLRVTVNDVDKVGTDSQFRANKAVGLVRHGKALQVIVGLDVAQVLERIQTMMSQAGKEHLVRATTKPTLEKATGFVDLLGGPANIQDLSACATRLRVRVVDSDKVGDERAFKQLKAFSVVKKSDHEVEIVTGLDADEVLAEMKGLL